MSRPARLHRGCLSSSSCARTAAVVALAFAPAACGLPGANSDDGECTPLRTLTQDDLLDMSFVALTPGFCEVARPATRHVFASRVPQVALIPEVAGYDTTWTLPPGTEIVQQTDASVDVRLRGAGGPVCMRHENACTPPGDVVCRTITVLEHNVWSPVDGLPIGTGGALAQDDDAVWWLNPLDSRGYGVWRIDKHALTAVQVADSFPEGNAEGFDFQGGAAIASGGFVHYLAGEGLFLFDTTTHAWQRAGTLPAYVTDTRTTVELDGKLWGLTPDALWRYDPATRTQQVLGAGVTLVEGVGFVVQGRVVFGAGRALTAAPSAPASWQSAFSFWDESGVAEPYELELPAGHYTQALDLGDTTILLTHDGPAYVVDEATRTVRLLEDNPDLGCAAAPNGERHGAYKGAGIAFDGIGLAVGGQYDTGTGSTNWRGGTLYFP